MQTTSGEVGENRDCLLAYIERQGHRACLHREDCTRVGCELRRQDCDSAGAVQGRGVFDPRSRTGPRDAAQGRTPHHQPPRPSRRRKPRQSRSWSARPFGLKVGTAPLITSICITVTLPCWPGEPGSGAADLRCHPRRIASRRRRNRRPCPMQNWRRWRNEDHSPAFSQEREAIAVGCLCGLRTLPILRSSSKPSVGPGPCNLRALSVAHHYEQNGDLMRDPEMCFELSRPFWLRPSPCAVAWPQRPLRNQCGFPDGSKAMFTSTTRNAIRATNALPGCGTSASPCKATGQRFSGNAPCPDLSRLGRARDIAARSCLHRNTQPAQKELVTMNTTVIHSNEYRDLPLALLTESRHQSSPYLRVRRPQRACRERPHQRRSLAVASPSQG